LVLNSDYEPASGEAMLQSGVADAIAFGRPFIANPDLVERIEDGLPLAKDNPATWYSQGREGYLDYPTAA
ncbi:MAG: alkene reductase, partial [Janthinobacterium lividum]